jgi:hypothetical protein
MHGAHFGPSGPSSVRVVTRSTQISVGLIDEGIVGGEIGIAVRRRRYRLDRLKRSGLKMKLKMKEFRWSVVSLISPYEHTEVRSLPWHPCHIREHVIQMKILV